MTETVIEFRNVSKTFTYVRNQPNSLKSLVISRLNGSYSRLERETKTVLDNVSFKVARGEAIGIMGRNGTGKTTLLRLLCGIYSPDKGQVLVQERIAPLVAVGAGLHPDLSGYENIFLSGAIMGVSRKSIQATIGAIIEFTELGSQINHLLKTYSSGMVLRLGFAIACHIDAPIIVLDEILGVGDEGFQNKCSRKMDEMFKSGRTIVLVTHDANQIVRFCRRCIVIEKGHIVCDGKPAEGSMRYSELFSAI